jgi:hypothetical protein
VLKGGGGIDVIERRGKRECGMQKEGKKEGKKESDQIR